jgi:uncharacterized protein YbaP (TraB family)
MRLVALASLIVALLGCKGEAKRVDRAGSSASGDNTEAPLVPTIQKPFLWKAEKGGTTSWLFGTIHLGVNAETQLPPWVMDKIGGVGSFVMEVDTSDPGAVAAAFQRTDGGSLRADLGPAHWKKLEDAIGARLAAGFDGMKPFAAMTVLLAKDLPMTPAMDGVFSSRAKAAGKPIHHLETAVEQIAMIDPWMGTADLKAQLDHPDLARASAQKLLEAYKAGDGAALGAMFDDQTLWLAAGRKPETHPAYLDALLGKRNRAWAPQIARLHDEGGVFVAVGAGHLVGRDNLLDLLAADGFTLTRVGGP